MKHDCQYYHHIDPLLISQLLFIVGFIGTTLFLQLDCFGFNNYNNVQLAIIVII